MGVSDKTVSKAERLLVVVVLIFSFFACMSFLIKRAFEVKRCDSLTHIDCTSLGAHREYIGTILGPARSGKDHVGTRKGRELDRDED
jgi:hypothetical protein